MMKNKKTILLIETDEENNLLIRFNNEDDGITLTEAFAQMLLEKESIVEPFTTALSIFLANRPDIKTDLFIHQIVSNVVALKSFKNSSKNNNKN